MNNILDEFGFLPDQTTDCWEIAANSVDHMLSLYFDYF